MESSKQELHNSKPAVETPILLSSSLPTNFLQFSSSALFPLGSSSAIGNVLSVPVVSHPFVSPMQQKQKLPMQNEPLLLLPASALSLSAHSNFVDSTPSLSSKIQPSYILHSQQLQLNSAQVPLMLKPSDSSVQVDQVFKAQQMNQQFIILPVEGGNVHPSPILDKHADSKTVSELRSVLGNSRESGDKKSDVHCKLNTTHSPADKCKSTKPKMKMRNVRKKKTFLTKSDSAAESSILATSDCEPNKLDIAQIISNIPSGWQVVGVTGLNNLALGDILSSSGSFSSLTSLLAIKPKISTGEANCEVKSEVGLLTEEITPHDQPSLVSVNLNTASQPVASETVFDKWPGKELTCSLKMDDIPCTHVISIKTECSDSNESNSGIAVHGSDFEHLCNDNQELAKTIGSHTDPCSTTETNIQSQDSGRKTVVESHGVSENMIPLQELSKLKSLGSGSSSAQPVLTNSKWTIIGITSLPPLPPTNTVTTSQAGMTALELTSNKGESSNISINIPSATNTTILKIPLCPSAAAPTNIDKTANISNRKNSLKSTGCSPVSLVLNDGSQSSSDLDLSVKTKPEDMNWTIVGVMGSSLNNSSTLNPCISSGSEFLSISNPITSSPLSTASLENVMNNQLLNILSTTSTNPLLLPVGSLPDQVSPNTQSKRKSKSQETVKKSPKAISSKNKDNLKQDNSSTQSQSQWKIVGVTQLGIPPTAASPVVPLSQLNPISPVMSMPLFFPAASGPLLSNLTAETTSIFTQATSTTPSSSLFSLSSSPSLLSSPALPFPILNLDGTSCSSTMALSSPSTLLGAASHASIQALQDLAQQQNLSQLIQSQLTACQNPISMLTLNETNQWNVVGVVANNQVSLLNSNQGNPPVVNTLSAVSKPSIQDSVSHIPVTSTQNIKSKRNLSSNEGRKRIKGAAMNKSVTIRQSLASRLEDSDGKRYFKCKDVMKKHHQESTKIKKNTVSSLLRIKRMQQRTCESRSSEDGDQCLEEYQDFSDTPYEVPQKKTKARSLRTYAGNRKMFTRTQNKTFDGKISLRSGTQIPVLTSKSEVDDDDAAQMSPADSINMEESVASIAEPEMQNNDKITVVKVEAHSSSRRRKLKVPRKLIADLDYHPYDSSSDSN